MARLRLPRLLIALAGLCLAACPQAQNPTPTGAALAGSGGGGAGTGAGGGTVTVRVSGGQGLGARFPGLARLLLSVTDASTPHQVAIQTNLPTNGGAIPLNLPANTPLTFTYDLFDAQGGYLGTGSTTVSLTGSGQTVIPVSIQAVAPGTPFVDPLTGQAIAGPVGSLSVSVFTGASLVPVAGAIVAVGFGADLYATRTTDAQGLATFPAVQPGTAVHVFAGGNAVSVLDFYGTALAVPMPETTPLPATVRVNPPAGPGVDASTLADVYLTDGVRVEPAGHLLGDRSPVFEWLALVPMRGPVGISAIIESPADPLTRPDRGFALAVAAGHHAQAPLSASLPDPYAQPRLATFGDSVSVAPPPAGLGTVTSVGLDVFRHDPATNAWHLVSHKDNTLTPATRRNVTVWQLSGGDDHMRVIRVSDGYAEVELRQHAPNLSAGVFAAPVYPASIPVASQPVRSPVPGAWADPYATSVQWTDPYGTVAWDGAVIELSQGVRQWRVHAMSARTQALLPPVPLGASAPLAAGQTAQVRVREYQLEPAAGFDPNNPDLWWWERMSRTVASSPVVSFTP